MMIAMTVVVAQHPAIISLHQKVVDKRKIVSSNLTIAVLPDLFPNQSAPGSAANRRNLIDNLPQTTLWRHNERLSQEGHSMPYLHEPLTHHPKLRQ